MLDLFSRRVVGWSMQPAMTAQLVTDALVTAVWRRGGVAAEALNEHLLSVAQPGVATTD